MLPRIPSEELRKNWKRLFSAYLSGVVDGSNGPSDANAQEDIDRIATGHIADRRVRVFVVDSRYLTGKRV